MRICRAIQRTATASKSPLPLPPPYTLQPAPSSPSQFAHSTPNSLSPCTIFYTPCFICSLYLALSRQALHCLGWRRLTCSCAFLFCSNGVRRGGNCIGVRSGGVRAGACIYFRITLLGFSGFGCTCLGLARFTGNAIALRCFLLGATSSSNASQ